MSGPNRSITVEHASRVGAQAEAERYFTERSGRTNRGQAKMILAKAGKRVEPRPEDRLDDKTGAD
jgi:hypothetical protein